MKFNKDVAKATVKKSLSLPKEEKEVSPLYRHFFDLKTGDPIPLAAITKRIKKRFFEIEKLSAYAMLDLYFVHQNWSSFYHREDSFKNYLKEEIQISKSHAYGILHAVALLEEHFSRIKANRSFLEFIEEVAATVEQVGIRKLRELASMKNGEQKHQLLSQLLKGEKITTQQIVEAKSTEQGRTKTTPHVYVKENVIYCDDKQIVTVQRDDDVLKNYLCKAVKKFFRGK